MREWSLKVTLRLFLIFLKIFDIIFIENEKGSKIMKGNQHNKLVFQDNFIKHWTTSADNHPEGWHWWKKKNRKKTRLKLKKDLMKEEENE